MGEVGQALHALADRLGSRESSARSGDMTDGRPEPRTDRVRFTGTADIERLLADAPGIRAALLEEGDRPVLSA